MPPPPPPPPHVDVFHASQNHQQQHEPPDAADTAPRVFQRRDVTGDDVTLAFDVIAGDDNVAMETQRTVVVANDNNDDDTVVARQPAASDDVRIDDVMQAINGNENDVILIPEAMIDGIAAMEFYLLTSWSV